MSLRQKLLLVLSLTVAAAVAAVAWTVQVKIRRVFEQRDQEETALIVAQFKREFQTRSAEVAAAVERIAASERMRPMAAEIAQNADPAPYLNEAQKIAEESHLDFLEIVAPSGEIVSSAQWPARFGYTEVTALRQAPPAFLKREELPDGTNALGVFALRSVRSIEPQVHVLGGDRLDKGFLASLPVGPGVVIGLYAMDGQEQGRAFDASRLVGAEGGVPGASAYGGLVSAAVNTGQQTSGILYVTKRRADSISATAIPLKDDAGKVLAVLTVALSRSGMVAAQQHVRDIAYGVASAGIVLAILFSLWIAARVLRPIEELARAAEQVATGDWDAHVPVRGRDEMTVLARSFNHMTEQLAAQRERLVQTERVAAWRELARRLAHELKNPLFPLQLTVENLTRSRKLPAAEFDEVFDESTRTLHMEIANLKTIIGRFSDFSKMPKPALERIDAADAVERVRALYASGSAENMQVRTELSSEVMPIMADPELLHRALSNLVLNAMDAMPDGGVVTLAAKPVGDSVEIRVSDTGQGMTPEECERLFTPYYTTKQHGTGLGLAIVQSVVADHEGTIAVESCEGQGATFIITLKRAAAWA